MAKRRTKKPVTAGLGQGSERPAAASPISLRIDAGRAGKTLAAVLREQLGGLPWNQARELCRRGKVQVDGVTERDGSRRLKADELVQLEPQKRLRQDVLEDSAVIHVDNHVLVVAKPAGVLSVRFEPEDRNTLADRARFWLRRRGGPSGDEVGAVQRLDKDTTGLLVFARTLAAKRHLQQQLRVRSVERRYLALVHGVLVTPQTIETDLVRNRGDGLRGSWGHFRKPQAALPHDAQHAITHVRPLRAFAAATLVECQLATGRQHQIRIHLSERGHPLIGEPTYVRDYLGPRMDAPRPMLHAAVLGFEHPATGRRLHFELPIPRDFEAVLERLESIRAR
ncbi:MAG: pseudouridine synthase [Polyangiales bacterium]